MPQDSESAEKVTEHKEYVLEDKTPRKNYRGRHFDTIPIGYLRWLTKRSGTPRRTRRLVRIYLSKCGAEDHLEIITCTSCGELFQPVVEVPRRPMFRRRRRQIQEKRIIKCPVCDSTGGTITRVWSSQDLPEQADLKRIAERMPAARRQDRHPF